MDKKTKMKFNVLAIICIIVFAFSLAPKTLQNDTFYTISIGEHIMENGVDGIDPFSWSDLKYTYPHWLYDVGIYLIYNVGGMTGIYISTIVLSMLLGVVLYITNLKVNKNNLFSFVITMGVMFMMKDFLAARAQLVTFILFVLEILFIECFLETKKKRYALLLMAIATLIANVHAAVFYVFFILMMPYFGEYIIVILREAHLTYKLRIKTLKRKIEKLTQKEAAQEKIEKVQAKLIKTEESFTKFKANSEKRKENPYKVKLVKRDAVKWLIVVAILCFAMGLLTPLGDEPYTHIFKLLSGNTTESISEHQPLVLAAHKGAITIFVMLLAMMIFTDTKITLKDLFMLGGLTVLTFSARRQLSLLLIIGGISFSRILCDFTDKYDKNGAEDFTKLMVTWKGKILTIVLAVLYTFIMYRGTIDDEYISSSGYPVDAADYILKEVEEGNLDFETMRLYNDYNYGSYLLYRGIPVFIDSRADLYSPEFNEGCDIFSDYMNISSISTYYETAFDKYEITHVIVYKNSKLNMFISKNENYKELYGDKYFVFYERLNASAESNEE